MSVLTDKFDVIRGWEPGGDASIDHSFPPALSGSTPVTLLPGYIVALASTGRVDVATSPANITTGTALVPKVYIVVEGNGSDTSAQFVEKVVCLRGKLTIKTDKLGAAQSFPVGGAVTYVSGLLEDLGATGTEHNIGLVIANDVATNGTITVDVDLG